MDHTRTIGMAIARRASGGGRNPALLDMEGREVTFPELLRTISSFAQQLAIAGLGREDRVAVVVPGGITGGRLVVALASNITVIPINPALTRYEIAEILQLEGLRAVVVPRWLKTSAGAAIRERRMPVLEAVLAPDGTLSLDLPAGTTQVRTRLRPVRQSDVALLLRSSGTTGAPKLIPVTHGNLVAMAEKLASDRWFGLTAQDRVPCTLPLYYAAGLKTSLLVPLILGQTVGFPPAGQALEVAAWIDVLKPTYLSVTPGSLNGIVERLRISAREFDGGSLRFVMCGAALLSEDVRAAAQSMLRVPVLEYYALSEAGAMAANPAPPGRIKPGTAGVPAPGELRLVDESGAPVATGAIGQIMIGGPTVTPGYVTTGVDSPGGFDNGWLLTGDLGRLDEDGYLTIVGRATEVINRGGEKVFPYEVESAILQHPAVLEAAVFGVPHPRLGENVAAALVLKPGSAVSERDLKAYLARRVAGFKMPRRLHFVSRLPRGETGKISRRSLGAAYAARRGAIVQPHDLLEVELRDLWARLLGTDRIGIDDDFLEIGGDSLLATEMLLEIERLTGKPYPQSELSTLTIRRIASVVTSTLSGERDLITQVKSGSGIPLFFCHGDYLTRGIYAHKLAALLPDDQPVYLLHCDAEREAGSNVEEIARAYLQEVVRFAPASPVFLGGYCNGGLAAWHLAHLLRSRGAEVVELLLIEALSLNARPELRGLARLLEAACAVVPDAAAGALRQRAMRAAWNKRRGVAGFASQLCRFARKQLTSLPGKPPPGPPLDASDLKDRAYLQLMSRYVPPRIDVHVTSFIATHGRRFDTDPRFWRNLAAGVSEVSVPGAHLTAIVSERPALAKALGEALRRATARYSLRLEMEDRAYVQRPHAPTVPATE